MVGDIHLAIADGIVCVRFDGDATALSFAKEESWWEHGSLVVEDHVGITSDREAGGADRQDCHRYVARVQGGRFDGLRAVGRGWNKRTRERAAHVAVTASVLARLEEPWPWTYNAMTLELVKHLQQRADFQMLYKEWPKEGVATNQMDDDPLAEDKELSKYVSIFTAVLDLERDADMEQGDLEERVRAGHTIRAAKLYPDGSRIEVKWEDGQGSRFKENDYVVLSRVLPQQYTFKHALRVCAVGPSWLHLDAGNRAPDAVAEGEWQVDRHVNASNYWRMEERLKQFVRRGSCPLVQLVAKELGTPAAREEMNRISEPWAGTVATTGQQEMQTITVTDQEALLDRIASEHGLNASQRAALAAVPGHHLTLIQGPPGTGKTSLAIAVLRLMRALHGGRSLAAAPSKAADNIAGRLRDRFRVGRYGHIDKISEI